MPRTCTICNHLGRETINAALLGRDSLRTISAHWSVSKTALIRHKADHLPAVMVKAKDAAEVIEADTFWTG
jgi:hypothetical protein